MIKKVTGNLLIPSEWGVKGRERCQGITLSIGFSRWGGGRGGAIAHRRHRVDAVNVIVRPAGRQFVGVLLLLEEGERLYGPPGNMGPRPEVLSFIH